MTTDTPDNVTLLDRIDGVRRGLIGMIETRDRDTLTKRPPSGEWSVVENVRHLLFAEQLHLGKFVPEGMPFSKLGLTPDFAREVPQFADVDTEPTDNLGKIIRAWDEVHQTILDAVIDSKAVTAKHLQDHLDHLLFHTKIIEQLLKEQSA
jgi:hypothetical protein